MNEPRPPRAIAFIDGQNLYHAARRAFGHHDQRLDIVRLAKAVCEPRGWRLLQTRYYTGLPSHRISLDVIQMAIDPHRSRHLRDVPRALWATVTTR